MKLLVRNIARSTSEAELKTLFEPYGAVQSCSLVLDNKSGGSKGFAFIEMPKPGEAKAAMKSLNGKDVGGKTIRVKKAEKS
jgi:RNA recognition motif-containing protein